MKGHHIPPTNVFMLSCLDNCLYARAQSMMGNDRKRPCDSCVLLDSAILAYTLLKIEFS